MENCLSSMSEAFRLFYNCKWDQKKWNSYQVQKDKAMTKSKPSLKRNTIQKKGYFTTVKCLVMINSLPGRHRVEVRTWSYQRHQSIISGQTLSKNCLILFNCNKLKNNHHTHQELRRKEFSSLSSLPIET